jgi:hypothetical protein
LVEKRSSGLSTNHDYRQAIHTRLARPTPRRARWTAPKDMSVSDEKGPKHANGEHPTVVDLDGLAEQDLNKLGYQQQMSRVRHFRRLFLYTVLILLVERPTTHPFQ